eukprot:1287724-Lingulodinium_polyedra.AAC.1
MSAHCALVNVVHVALERLVDVHGLPGPPDGRGFGAPHGLSWVFQDSEPSPEDHVGGGGPCEAHEKVSCGKLPAMSGR